MLLLKLNLPSVDVRYGKTGNLETAQVPFVPEKIKNTGMSFDITGYSCEDGFFAYKLQSPDRAFTLAEQFTMLTKLGFHVIPTCAYPNVEGTVDYLIKTAGRYEKYKPIWWDNAKDEEYKIPHLTTIRDIVWGVDPKGRVYERLITDDGEYDVLDLRTPEYYQIGLQVKIWNGEARPYMVGPIIETVPTRCPKCNNPLKKLQISNDLPLILKCVNPVCKLIKTTEDSVPADTTDTADTAEAESSAEQASDIPADVPYMVGVDLAEEECSDEPIADDVYTPPAPKPTVLNVEADLPDDLKDKVIEVKELGDAPILCVVTRSKRAVTRLSRTLAKQANIPLIPVDELDDFLFNN